MSPITFFVVHFLLQTFFLVNLLRPQVYMCGHHIMGYITTVVNSIKMAYQKRAQDFVQLCFMTKSN